MKIQVVAILCGLSLSTLAEAQSYTIDPGHT